MIHGQKNIKNIKINKNVIGRICSTHGKYEWCIRGFLVGRPDRKRPLKRQRRGCEDNIKIDLQELGRGVWVRLIWLMIWTGGVLL